MPDVEAPNQHPAADGLASSSGRVHQCLQSRPQYALAELLWVGARMHQFVLRWQLMLRASCLGSALRCSTWV